MHLTLCSYLNGAELTMFYSWHTIPCVGFKVAFAGKSFIYSADHMNNPAHLSRAWEEGRKSNDLNEGRRNFLAKFDYNHDCVFHELGRCNRMKLCVCSTRQPEFFRRTLGL